MQPGQMLSANLRLVRLLDQGSLGSLWIAFHLGLRTQVAVKLMTMTASGDPTLVAFLAREAHEASQLRSSHATRVLEYGVTAEGAPFTAMELLEGESLRDRLRRAVRLSLLDTATILTQASEIIGEANERGILHRDLRPSNLFLVTPAPDPSQALPQRRDPASPAPPIAIFVKVLGFGIAKQSHEELDLTKTFDKVATPLYMSPEQLLSSARNVDFRTDLWSLAAVAYHCVTGQPPFNADTLLSLCMAVSRGTFEPPSKLWPDLPQALDLWFLRALRRDPAGRFPSATDMAREFERAALGPGDRGTGH